MTVFLCQQERHSFDEYNKRGDDVKKRNELELEPFFYIYFIYIYILFFFTRIVV